MPRSAAHPWYSDGLKFTCTQCGNCCGGAPGYVWLHPLEIDQIADAIGMTPAEFIERHTRMEHGRRSLLEIENGDCEFLERTANGKSRCTIHAVRPAQCRTWPFWESNLRSEKAWQATARGCPGMNHGLHHPLPVIQQALAQNEERRLPL